MPVPPATPVAFVRAIFTPWVALGIVLLITWLLSRMMFLSFADLSYMLPVTSLGYVATALLGRFFLHETITLQRWGGTLLIMAGTMMVSSGRPDTTAGEAEKIARGKTVRDAEPEISRAAGATAAAGEEQA